MKIAWEDPNCHHSHLKGKNRDFVDKMVGRSASILEAG